MKTNVNIVWIFLRFILEGYPKKCNDVYICISEKNKLTKIQSFGIVYLTPKQKGYCI